MGVDEFVAQFPLFTSAPGGIEKLKGLILHLAVTGKLTASIPSEGSGHSLKEQVIATRELLIKEKKIKRLKIDPLLSQSYITNDLPKHWGWALLGELITQMDAGWSPACDPEPAEQGCWGVLKTTAVQTFEYRDYENKSLPVKLSPKKQYEVHEGDILFTRAGPKDRVGICCLVEKTQSKLMTSDKIIRVHLVDEILYEKYIALTLNAGVSRQFLESQKSGMAESQMNISQPKLRATPIPLPPLEEQKRIVTKVDELMALCDKLEAQQQQQANNVLRANTSAINALLNPSDPETSFEQNWQRIAQHFNTLYSCTLPMPEGEGRKKKYLVGLENVKAFKQAITQLAFSGKLSTKLSTDGNIDTLLEEINRLPKDKRTRKYRGNEVIIDSYNIDFPLHWKLVPLAKLFGFLGGFAYKSNSYINTPDNQIIRLGNVKSGFLLLDQKPAYIPNKLAEETEKYQLLEKDIVITMTGTKGKRDYCYTCQITKKHLKNRKLFINQRVGCLSPFGGFDFPAAKVFLKSDFFIDKLLTYATGTANQGNIGSNALMSMRLPFPPIEEQKRIVAKVNQLMTLCDQLEQQLTQSYTAAETLMEATTQALVA